MKPEESKELFSLITALFIAKGKQMPIGTLDVWMDDLEEFPMDKIREAFKIERRDSKHEWPMVSHIIDLMDNVESLAHGEFQKIESFHGWHPDIGWTSRRTWNDAADRSLREIGGIGMVMDATEKNISFIRRDFIKAYERNKNVQHIERPMLSHEPDEVFELPEGKK
jgi:hypothetical protein